MPARMKDSSGREDNAGSRQKSESLVLGLRELIVIAKADVGLGVRERVLLLRKRALILAA